MEVWNKLLCLLLAISVIGSVIYPTVALKTENDLSKNLQILKQTLKQRKLNYKQIDRIMKTIEGLSKYLPRDKVREIIKAYLRNKEYVYTVFSLEEQEKIRKLMMTAPPSGPAFLKLNEIIKGKMFTTTGFYDVQKDGRMYTVNYRYSGISGKVYPGTLQVSLSGTHRHYLTSHVGEPVNGVPQWLEVGIVSDANDQRYIVYTWDSDNPEKSKWQSHFETRFMFYLTIVHIRCILYSGMELYYGQGITS